MAQARRRAGGLLLKARGLLASGRGIPVIAGIAISLAAAAFGAAAFLVPQQAGVVLHQGDGGESGKHPSDGDAKLGAAPDEEAAPSTDSESGPAENELTVDIDGAVIDPGVFTLGAGSRVEDAIEAAGGLAHDADTSGLNRASPLTDGQKVRVPAEGEALTQSSLGAAAGTSPQAGEPTVSAGLVNINTAGTSELDALPGVGPSTAQAIVEDREANGAFKSIEDIMRVTGIGEKKFEKLKSSICV